MSRSRTFRPQVESLEDRCVPSTFTVKNLNDSGPNSLRQAILEANSAVGADTLNVKAGLTGTINLNGSMSINDHLFLKGPGASKLTLDGGGVGSIFSIRGGVNVTLKGIGLRNGFTAAGSGGAILNFGNLTLSKVVARDNQANRGGAIASSGPLLLINSIITGNQATVSGGGIYAEGPDNAVTLWRSTVANNKAGAGGGISALTLSALTIAESTVSGNQALSAGGGGILSTSPTEIRRSQISGNSTASGGGGILASDRTEIRDSTIRGNTATGSGGGIRQNSGSLLLQSSTVSGNIASGNGGGVYLQNPTTASTLTHSTLSGNTSLNGSGGGVYLLNTAVAVVIGNSTLSGNKARDDGGGLNAGASSPVRLQNSTIAFNQAGTDGTGNGGGIAASDTDIILQSTMVARNTAATSGPDLHTTTTTFSLEFSLIGNGTGFLFDEPIPNSNLFDVDPRLAPLANNGGPTTTHALKNGSPAINRGSNPTARATDQRGGSFRRILGGLTDIGAFERQ